jgi:hypothetical protein
MKNWLREVKPLVQDHTARKQKGWGLSPHAPAWGALKVSPKPLSALGDSTRADWHKSLKGR